MPLPPLKGDKLFIKSAKFSMFEFLKEKKLILRPPLTDTDKTS